MPIGLADLPKSGRHYQHTVLGAPPIGYDFWGRADDQSHSKHSSAKLEADMVTPSVGRTLRIKLSNAAGGGAVLGSFIRSLGSSTTANRYRTAGRDRRAHPPFHCPTLFQACRHCVFHLFQSIDSSFTARQMLCVKRLEPFCLVDQF